MRDGRQLAVEIIFSVTDNTLIAELFGELDHHAAEGAREKIDEALDNYRVDNLVFDFAKISFMDSSGIAVALRGWQRMREVGGSVLLRHVAKQPRKVFEASGVGRMMTIE